MEQLKVLAKLISRSTNYDSDGQIANHYREISVMSEPAGNNVLAHELAYPAEGLLGNPPADPLAEASGQLSLIIGEPATVGGIQGLVRVSLRRIFLREAVSFNLDKNCGLKSGQNSNSFELVLAGKVVEDAQKQVSRTAMLPQRCLP